MGSQWFQDKISNKLQNHFFSNIIIDTTSNLHHTHLKSCASPRMNAWIFVHSTIPPFHITSNVFPYALCIKLGLPHPLVFRVTHYIGGQTLDLARNHLLCCSHGGKWIAPHDVIWNAFTLIMRDMFQMNKPMSFHHLPFNFLIGGLTSCYQLMTLTPRPMWSSSIPFNKFGFLHYLISWGGCDNGDSSKKKALTQSTPKECVSSPCDRNLWVPTPTNKWFSSSLC